MAYDRKQWQMTTNDDKQRQMTTKTANKGKQRQTKGNNGKQSINKRPQQQANKKQQSTIGNRNSDDNSNSTIRSTVAEWVEKLSTARAATAALTRAANFYNEGTKLW